MSAPIAVLTGIDAEAMAATMVGLQWDLPKAVALRHVIDVERQVLTRIVSDADGVVERTHLDLEHACVNCAVREDIIPTLERLADTGNWESIIAHLPVAGEAQQLCRLLSSDDRLGSKLHVAQVVAVVAGEQAGGDLLGDDLLRERQINTSAEDSRGVGETLASMIEYADMVVIDGDISRTHLDLVRVLSRPTAALVTDKTTLDMQAIVGAQRAYDEAENWVDPERPERLGVRQVGAVWSLELRSDRPFHPERLMENLEGLGGGSRRSRGCFWLPTRPETVCQWDGAGGQLSVGVHRHGPSTAPHTCLIVTGVDDSRDEVATLFEYCLLNDDELAIRGQFWEAAEDGYEPWLGPVNRLIS